MVIYGDLLHSPSLGVFFGVLNPQGPYFGASEPGKLFSSKMTFRAAAPVLKFSTSNNSTIFSLFHNPGCGALLCSFYLHITSVFLFCFFILQGLSNQFFILNYFH